MFSGARTRQQKQYVNKNIFAALSPREGGESGGGGDLVEFQIV
jgi:hypothetical protein